MTDAVLDILWKISWQAGALAVVVWIVTKLTPKAPARFRYALWTLVLIKFLVPPFVHLPSSSVPQKSPEPEVAKAVQHVPPVPMADELTPYETPTSGPAPSSPAAGASSFETTSKSTANPLDLIAIAWLVGIGGVALAIIARWLMQIWLTAQSTAADAKLTDLLALAARKMQLAKLPAIRYSNRVSTPMLIGVTQPTILLPAGLSGHCSETDIEAMLLHELAHIKRKDMLVVWLHQLVMIPFFFHPALWLAGKELRKERELACDEMVLSESGIDRKEYASGYVSALKMANASAKVPASLAMAEPFEVEKRRLDKILHSPLGRRTIWSVVGLSVIAVIGIPTISGIVQKKPAVSKPRHQLVTPDQVRYLALGEQDMPFPAILTDFKLKKSGWMYEIWAASPNTKDCVSIRTVVSDSRSKAIEAAEKEIRQNRVSTMDVSSKPVFKSFADKAQFGVIADKNKRTTCAWILFVRGNVVCNVWHYNKAGDVKPQNVIDLAKRLSKRIDAVMAGNPMPDRELPEPLADSGMTVDTAWALRFSKVKPAPVEDPNPNSTSLAGLTALEGPGVIVTLQDSKKPYPAEIPEQVQENMIHDSDIQRLVNELKSAGAEALSINGERIVATTAIRCVGPRIMVNNAIMTSPFRITAIGDPNALEQAIMIQRGFLDSFTDKEMVSISRFQKVKLPAYSGQTRYKWAKPAE